MPRHTVTIAARKVGAIGTMGAERRTYTLESPEPVHVNVDSPARSALIKAACERAYAEGLEHCLAVAIDGQPTAGSLA